MDDIDILRLQRPYATFSLWRLKNQKDNAQDSGAGRKLRAGRMEGEARWRFEIAARQWSISLPRSVMLSRTQIEAHRFPFFPST
jgi:hypothetical protein